MCLCSLSLTLLEMLPGFPETFIPTSALELSAPVDGELMLPEFVQNVAVP